MCLDADKENDASSQGDANEAEYETNEIDTATTAGLLETCVIVWEGIKDELDKVYVPKWSWKSFINISC